MAARHTITIRASITAYSTAVGPSSRRRKFFTLWVSFFIDSHGVVTEVVYGPLRESDLEFAIDKTIRGYEPRTNAEGKWGVVVFKGFEPVDTARPLLAHLAPSQPS
jgi:hypothetical protein